MPKKIIIKYTAIKQHFNDVSRLFLEDDLCRKSNKYEIDNGNNVFKTEEEEEEYLPQLSFLKEQSMVD